MSSDPAAMPVPADSPATAPPVLDTKWWGNSITIWGAIVTALSTVLPALAPLIGLNITADLVRQLGTDIVAVGQAVGGLAGTIMAIYGRVRATAQIERRQFTVTM